jgi:hypothetical protein
MNNTQFKTTGRVEPIYDKDGLVKAYYVYREGRGPLHLSLLIDEYTVPDVTVAIDRWGRPWVRR